MKKLYLPDGITREERTKILNERLRAVKPGACLERTRLVTESYQQTEGQPSILRKAKALAHLLRNMTIFILDEELIVGNHTSKQRCAPFFPEVNVFSEKELDLFPKRNVDTIYITEEEKKELLEEIYPYWLNKNVESIASHYIPDKTLRVLHTEHTIFDPTSRARSGYGHFIPNFQKVLSSGFKKIEEETKEKLKSLNPLDPDIIDRMLFYKSALIICEAVVTFASRYAEMAKDMACKKLNSRRKEELKLIAKVCEKVPYNPARTFHEALQAYWFTLLICYLEQNGGGVSAGRFDQYMYSFYKRDIDSGKLTKGEAQELLETLWVKHCEIIKAATYRSSRNTAGFPTTIHLTLAGIDKEGKDAVNELSWLCLEVERNVFNSEPNTGVRVHSSTPENFLLKAVDILGEKHGGKLPFFNDNAIIQALMSDGVPLDMARDYGIVGCVEPTPQGNTFGATNSCYSCIPKALELALNNGKCRLCGKQIGPATGNPREFETFEKIKEAFIKQVRWYIGHMVCALNSIQRTIANYYPHPYCSLLVDGCLEKGMDATRGGAEINYTGPQGIGIADTADSLIAVKKLVYDEKKIPMDELLDALDCNFEGKEALRQTLMNRLPKYGNDIDEVDELAQFAAKVYCQEVKKAKDSRGGQYRPGLYTITSNIPLGENVGALPSGRKAKESLADGGISPKHGMDENGPFAAMKSVAKIDHSMATNGTLLNQKYFPTELRTIEGKKRLVNLIRSYFSLGAFHVQFNIVDNKTLREAQKNPQNYRSLVVRVAGYSAFFVELDKFVQDDIIARTTYAN